jgi:carboxylesterase type B
LLDLDLVVVTINYRLGPLGFLTTEDTAAPPNLGLQDQQLALAWVQQHISAFGGDPGRVTVCGQEAGGTSVMALVASPRARGLFQQAIAMSGVWNYHPFLYSSRDEPRRNAALLAAQLGCGLFTDTSFVINCLQLQDAAHIVEAAAQYELYGHLPIVFKPVADSFMAEPVLPADPWRTRPPQDVPLIIGVNRDAKFIEYQVVASEAENDDILSHPTKLIFLSPAR